MAEAKRQQLKKVDAAQMALGVYHATFTDGTEFKADIREIFPEFDKAPAMAQRTVCYGLKQKLDDSMAGVDNIEEAVQELQSTWTAIVAGNWVTRVPGEGIEGGLFARAFAEWKAVSLADAKSSISKLVEKNLAANQERYKGQKDAPEITERMVFNKLRDTYLDRNSDLKGIYEGLKAKKAEKAKNRPSAVEITEDLAE